MSLLLTDNRRLKIGKLDLCVRRGLHKTQRLYAGHVMKKSNSKVFWQTTINASQEGLLRQLFLRLQPLPVASVHITEDLPRY
jgi:hypothetical protein